MIFASLAGYVPPVVDNNVWRTQRNLTSSNVVFNQLYINAEEDPVWVSNFMVKNDGSFSVENDEAEFDAPTMAANTIVGDNYIIIDASFMGVDTYQAIEFDEYGHAKFYGVDTGVDISGNDPLGAIKAAYELEYENGPGTYSISQ